MKFQVDMKDDMLKRLEFLVWQGRKPKLTMPELERILKVHYAHKPPELIEAEKSFDPKERFTQKDVVLITYGDIVRGKDGKSPLASLYEFVELYNQGRHQYDPPACLFSPTHLTGASP